MVCGVSFDDHEIGRQTAHSVATVAVVVEQLATSKPLTSTAVSLNSFTQFADRFMRALAL